MAKSEKTEAIELVGSLLSDIALFRAAIAVLEQVRLDDSVDDANNIIQLCRRRVAMLQAAYVKACNAVR